MRRLAEDPSFGLPIVCHPAILGAMLGGGSDGPDDVPIRGFSHKVLLGILPRLCGADATIFPSFGGRFGFSERECRDIALGSRQKLGSTPAIVPCPGGGMTLERVRKMNEVYGEDVMLLIGGSLMGHSPDLVANARHFLGVAGRQDTYGPLENVRGEHGGFGGVHASSSSSPRLSASERRHRDRSPRAGAVSLSPAPEGAVSLSTAAAHPGRVSLSPRAAARAGRLQRVRRRVRVHDRGVAGEPREGEEESVRERRRRGAVRESSGAESASPSSSPS